MRNLSQFYLGFTPNFVCLFVSFLFVCLFLGGWDATLQRFSSKIIIYSALRSLNCNFHADVTTSYRECRRRKQENNTRFPRVQFVCRLFACFLVFEHACVCFVLFYDIFQLEFIHCQSKIAFFFRKSSHKIKICRVFFLKTRGPKHSFTQRSLNSR